MDGQITIWNLMAADNVENVEIRATRDFDVIQKMITRVLMRGSGFKGGKERIYKAVCHTTTNKELAEQLKDEYGIGGSSGFMVEHLDCKYYDYDAKGIRITTTSKFYPVHQLSWLDVAQRVRLLVTKGDYI